MAIPPHTDRNATLLAVTLGTAYALTHLTVEQLTALGALMSVLQPFVQAALTRRKP
jgi:hypothetical protein